MKVSESRVLQEEEERGEESFINRREEIQWVTVMCNFFSIKSQQLFNWVKDKATVDITIESHYRWGRASETKAASM